MSINRLFSAAVLVCSFWLFAQPLCQAAESNWPQQQQRINYLLSAIENAPLRFIRNGTEHSPQEAAAHLRMKLRRGQNSWFAPAKEKWTAEMFIDKLASKSSFSGKPYQIEWASGERINAADWLYQQLAIYDQQQP
ncbi:DUF5329 family protein [Agarivorans sp.]|uniref:DUF5329 family protein n=1 Tax=Agarivorans sp. TaxID=1872412 RepID=UPI003D077C46